MVLFIIIMIIFWKLKSMIIKLMFMFILFRINEITTFSYYTTILIKIKSIIYHKHEREMDDENLYYLKFAKHLN